MARTDNPLALPPRLYWKHGAFYYVEYQPDGRKRWLRLGTDRAAAVAEAVRRNDSGDMDSLAHWYGEFLAACRRRVGKPKAQHGISQRTADDYTEAGVELLKAMGHIEPTAIRPHHVAAYLKHHATERERPIRANREKAALSACFSWLMTVEDSGVVSNPCAGVKRNREDKRDRYVTDDEYRAVYALAGRSGRVMMELVYRTLQRPSDVLSWRTRANLQRVPSGDPVLGFRQSKTGRWLTLAVTPEIAAALPQRSEAVARLDEPLVQRLDGEHYTESGLASMLRRWCEKAGVPSFGFADLKGKGATDMYHDGVSINLIRDLCGHTSTRTTEIYIKARTRTVVEPNRRVI